MKRLIILLVLGSMLILPAHGLDMEMPSAPPEAEALLPEEGSGLMAGFGSILGKALGLVLPGLRETTVLCAGVLAAVILCAMFSGMNETIPRMVGTAAVSFLLIGPTETLIRQALHTAAELSDYGKLLLPVMTGALAASGGTTKAAGLYFGTVLFDDLLMQGLSTLVIPLIHVLLALTVASAAMGNKLLNGFRDFLKKVLAWGLKLTMTLFSGYMTLTGVISGTADGAALKAARLAFSGLVPVVGGMLSDAAETVLIGAGTVRVTAGAAGLTAVLALTAVPLLNACIQYFLLKLTGALCMAAGGPDSGELVDGISQVMGFAVGVLGAAALLQMISLVCFMKGVS